MKNHQTIDLFIFTGEPSGDLHGAAILSSLQKRYPNLNITAVAGPKMRAYPINLLMPMEEFQVMGFIDVFKSLPRLIKHFKAIRDFILYSRPTIVLFIDYPGFNLRMAKALRKRAYKGKLIQYICPTVWAHGKKRIPHLAQTLDQLLTIFPFEAKYFSSYSLPVHYVGHPLVESAKSYRSQTNWKNSLQLKNKEHLIGIFPGSRKSEIENNLLKQLLAAELIKAKLPSTHFAISVAHDKLLPVIQKQLKAVSLKLGQDICLVPSKDSAHLMAHCTTAIATSGTVTFELAAKHVPTVVVYHVSFFNWCIAKMILKLNLPFYCIVNIICQKGVFPELLHKAFTPQNVFEACYRLETVKDIRIKTLKGCQDMLDLMQNQQAPAEAITDILGELIHG